MNRREHISLGIKKWLKDKGINVEGDAYTDLLAEYCYTQPDFDQTRVKGVSTLEGFIDKRFHNFCSYCGIKLKKEWNTMQQLSTKTK